MRLCILSATLFNGISVDSTEEKSKSISVFDNRSSSPCLSERPFAQTDAIHLDEGELLFLAAMM